MQQSAFIPIMVIFMTSIIAPIIVLLMVTNRKFVSWMGTVLANIASGALANVAMMFPMNPDPYPEPIYPLPYILSGLFIGFVCSLAIFLAWTRGRRGPDE